MTFGNSVPCVIPFRCAVHAMTDKRQYESANARCQAAQCQINIEGIPSFRRLDCAERPAATTNQTYHAQSQVAWRKSRDSVNALNIHAKTASYYPSATNATKIRHQNGATVTSYGISKGGIEWTTEAAVLIL